MLNIALAVHRCVINGFYLIGAVITPVAFYLVWKRKILKFGVLLYLISCLINFLWEASMILAGSRIYVSGLGFYFHLIYHSLTEIGPYVLIFVLLVERLGLISLKRYEDKNA